MPESVLLMFSSRNCLVSDLTFKYLTCFKFICVYSMRKYSNIIVLHLVVQFSQHHILKKMSIVGSYLFLCTKKKVWEPVHRCRLCSANALSFLLVHRTESKLQTRAVGVHIRCAPSICYSSQASQWPAPEPGTIIVSQSWLTSCDATC